MMVVVIVIDGDNGKITMAVSLSVDLQWLEGLVPQWSWHAVK